MHLSSTTTNETPRTPYVPRMAKNCLAPRCLSSLLKDAGRREDVAVTTEVVTDSAPDAPWTATSVVDLVTLHESAHDEVAAAAAADEIEAAVAAVAETDDAIVVVVEIASIVVIAHAVVVVNVIEVAMVVIVAARQHHVTSPAIVAVRDHDTPSPKKRDCLNQSRDHRHAVVLDHHVRLDRLARPLVQPRLALVVPHTLRPTIVIKTVTTTTTKSTWTNNNTVSLSLNYIISSFLMNKSLTKYVFNLKF